MSQLKIHRPYTYLGRKADRSYQLALAIPLNEGEILSVPTVNRVNHQIQVTVTINLSNHPKGEVRLHRTNPEITNIRADLADDATELEVVIGYSDNKTLLRDYCNLSLADADIFDREEELTEKDLLPLLLLQQTGWADAANGNKHKYLPDTVWVGTNFLEVAPGDNGGIEVSLMNGKKRKPRVPTNPCPPPQGQFTGNGNNGQDDNHDNTIVNLVEQVAGEKEPFFESVMPRV